MKRGILHYVFGLVLLGVLFGVLLRMRKPSNEPYATSNSSAGASMKKGASMKASPKGPSLGVKGASLIIVPVKGTSLSKPPPKKKKGGASGGKPKAGYKAGASGGKPKKAGSSLSSGVKGTSMGITMPALQGVSLKGGPASGASLTQLLGPSYGSAHGASMLSLQSGPSYGSPKGPSYGSPKGPSYGSPKGPSMISSNKKKDLQKYFIDMNETNICFIKNDWDTEGENYSAYITLNLVFKGISPTREIISLTKDAMDISIDSIKVYLVTASAGYWPSRINANDTAYPDEPTLLKGETIILDLDDDSIVWGSTMKDGKNAVTAKVDLEMPLIAAGEGMSYSINSLRMDITPKPNSYLVLGPAQVRIEYGNNPPKIFGVGTWYSYIKDTDPDYKLYKDFLKGNDYDTASSGLKLTYPNTKAVVNGYNYGGGHTQYTFTQKAQGPYAGQNDWSVNVVVTEEPYVDDPNYYIYQSEAIFEEQKYDADGVPIPFKCAEKIKKFEMLNPRSQQNYITYTTETVYYGGGGYQGKEDYLGQLFSGR